MTITFTYKQGVSLYFGSQLLNDADEPESGVGVDLTCVAQHKANGEIRQLELVWVDRPAGTFEFWAPGDGTCSDWALGSWDCDVVCSRPGVAPGGRALVQATETVNLLILERP